MPSLDQVHWTRLWLEENSLAEARRHLSEVRRALAWHQPDNDAEAYSRVSEDL